MATLGILGVVWISKSGLGIFFSEFFSRNFDFDTRSAIFGTAKKAKTAHFPRFWGTKN